MTLNIEFIIYNFVQFTTWGSLRQEKETRPKPQQRSYLVTVRTEKRARTHPEDVIFFWKKPSLRYVSIWRNRYTRIMLPYWTKMSVLSVMRSKWRNVKLLITNLSISEMQYVSIFHKKCNIIISLVQQSKLLLNSFVYFLYEHLVRGSWHTGKLQPYAIT